MRNTRLLAHGGVLSGVAILVASMAATSNPAALSSAEQARALTDLLAQLLTCSASTPCLGDHMKRVREAVHDAIVTDDTSFYSDLDVAYPSVRGVLDGIVEWEFDEDLESVSIRITDFAVAPPVVAALLERDLEGCRIEWEADDPDSVEEDEVPLLTTSCLAVGPECRQVSVDAYFGPDLLIVELSL